MLLGCPRLPAVLFLARSDCSKCCKGIQNCLYNLLYYYIADFDCDDSSTFLYIPIMYFAENLSLGCDELHSRRVKDERLAGRCCLLFELTLWYALLRHRRSFSSSEGVHTMVDSKVKTSVEKTKV